MTIELSRTISHVAAEAGWRVVEAISAGQKLLPLSETLSKSPVIAWLIESYCYDRGDGSTRSETTVEPITPEGQPNGHYLLQHPDGRLTMPDGSEICNESEALALLRDAIGRDLQRAERST